MKKFNDSKSDSQIFLITYFCDDIELNLHHMCLNLMLLKSAVSVNIIKQIFEQINCLEQAKKQQIWILFQQHFFNRSKKFNAAKKMINKLSSEFLNLFALYVQNVIDEAVTQHKTANFKKVTVKKEIIQIKVTADTEVKILIMICNHLL